MHELIELENYATENHIPIARQKTVEYMISHFKKYKYNSFFEIGTAIGYTTLIMAKVFPKARIVTIEHDLERAVIAKENFKDFEVENNIQFIIDDATLFQTDEMFDLIFIDAAKKKNQFFLDKFARNLNQGGTIIVDNMNLTDLWIKINVKNREKYNQINKEFKEYITSLKEFDVSIYDDIGDGIAVLIKK